MVNLVNRPQATGRMQCSRVRKRRCGALDPRTQSLSQPQRPSHFLQSSSEPRQHRFLTSCNNRSTTQASGRKQITVRTTQMVEAQDKQHKTHKQTSVTKKLQDLHPLTTLLLQNLLLNLQMRETATLENERMQTPNPKP